LLIGHCVLIASLKLALDLFICSIFPVWSLGWW